METKITPKIAFADILDMWDLMKDKMDPDKEYYPLLKLIEDNRWYEDHARPTLKEVARLLNVQIHILSKWIFTIYTPWLDEENPPRIAFKTVVEFHLSNMQKTAVFESQDILFLPRRGETVNTAYFNNSLGNRWYYYVDSVSHYFDKGEHRIALYIKDGEFNEFWAFRKDEAYVRGEISTEDYYRKDDWNLKKQLKISPYFAWLRMEEEKERRDEAVSVGKKSKGKK